MLIFVAEPNEDLRVGLQMYLQNEVDMRVVGMSVQAKGLVVQLEASEADVLVLDWNLPGASMPNLLADIRRLESPPKTIVLAVRPEVEEEALDAGADSFVCKDRPPDELWEVIRSLRMTRLNSTE
jgi:DNA-binding NarL/FixJ family response regulator